MNIELYTAILPNRDGRKRDRQRLASAAKAERTVKPPKALKIEELREAPNVFQPRYDSIAFAPGRTEGHVKHLTQTIKQGQALDPITVATFGGEWYVLDGHHRLAAYREAKWTDPIPVDARASDKTGMERVDWAVGLSIEDNKKLRLATSPTDNADAAWLAIARGDTRSKAEQARAYNVSDSTIAAMRRTAEGLRKHMVELDTAISWRDAKRKLRQAEGEDSDDSRADWEENTRRQLAKRLKPVMDMHPTPGELAEALEQYARGIIMQMAAAMEIAEGEQEESGSGLEWDE